MKRGHDEVDPAVEMVAEEQTEPSSGEAGASAPVEAAPVPKGASAGARAVAEPPGGSALVEDVTKLKSDIAALEGQLAELQENHKVLTAEHSTLSSALPKNRPPHDPSWEVHTNPTNGVSYYFNKRTQVSSYDKPADYNPRPKPEIPPELNVKGPPGANLFVVRKMRRGDFDDFDEADLREAFGKYGTVLRCELATDAQTGWSRGYGFVSMSSPAEAAAAIEQGNGIQVAGKEMKIELTKEDGSKKDSSKMEHARR
jgi:hypothetical protein